MRERRKTMVCVELMSGYILSAHIEAKTDDMMCMGQEKNCEEVLFEHSKS